MRSAFEDDPLDAAFPLGDGTADTESDVLCPHCGETANVALDPGSGASQDYVEDCPVCCRPWRMTIRYASNGAATVTAIALDA